MEILTNTKFVCVILFLLIVNAVIIFDDYTIIQKAHGSHNANLFVSAENPTYQNYFAGPMVIEVVVSDLDISDTDVFESEPDVTVNGKRLRMTQGIDGKWYGYFADRTQAQAADMTQAVTSSYGLQFGAGCTSATASGISGVTLNDTSGVFFPRAIKIDTGTPAGVLNDCSGYSSGPSNFLWMHVVREPPTLSSPPTGLGQIGLNAGSWPFIQLYDFNPTGNVIVKYSKGGGDQIVTLTFDAVDQYVTMDLDKTSYLTGRPVFITLTDPQLNIDPTDEDSWSWGTKPGSETVFYQLFDENGDADSDGTTGAVDLRNFLIDLMFEDNGMVTLNADAQGIGTFVVNLRDNNDQKLTVLGDITTAQTQGVSIPAGLQPISFTEVGPNSGVFRNSDESGLANLLTTSNAIKNSSATIEYLDGQTQTILITERVFTPDDITPPVVNPPPQQIVEAISPDGAIVTYSPPTATDNVGVTVGPTCPPSGSMWSVDRHLRVLCTAEDAAGNVGRAYFSILVQDTTPPSIEQVNDINLDATGLSGARASYPLPSASDIVDANPTVSCSPSSGSLFLIGDTIINCTATDYSGNSASTPFTLTVLEPLVEEESRPILQPKPKIIVDVNEIKEGTPVIFLAEGNYPNKVEDNGYQWSFSDGSDRFGKTVTHTFNDNDQYLVSLTVHDVKDLKGTASKVLQVLNVDPLITYFRSDKLTISPGDEIQLSGEFYDPGVVDTYTVEWYLGDEQPLTKQEVSSKFLSQKQLFENPGTYELTLVVKDDDGGLDKQHLTIVVEEPFPIEIIIAASVAAGGGGVVATKLLKGKGKGRGKKIDTADVDVSIRTGFE